MSLNKILVLLTVSFSFERSSAQQEYGIRLSGGRHDDEGRVEVQVGNQWGTVCSDGRWGWNEANVACRQLGYNYAHYLYWGDFYGGLDINKLITRVECTGEERSLSECSHQLIGGDVVCQATNHIAGVVCANDLPDLVPDASEVKDTAHIVTRYLYEIECAVEEKCVSSLAQQIPRNSFEWFSEPRKLLRFTSSTWNEGSADFRPPLSPEQWIWHECHQHNHSMEVFATYDILDLGGSLRAEGHKASFCLEDTMCKPSYEKQYTCGLHQGISVGCADVYSYRIDCQWIDVTDVKRGRYILQIHINPGRLVAESNFDNNVVHCDVRIKRNRIRVRRCRYPNVS